jgi:hypothetical protein
VLESKLGEPFRASNPLIFRLLWHLASGESSDGLQVNLLLLLHLLGGLSDGEELFHADLLLAASRWWHGYDTRSSETHGSSLVCLRSRSIKEHMGVRRALAKSSTQ